MKSLSAIFLALILAIFCGTMLGYPLDPQNMREVQRRLERTLEKGKAYAPGEVDRIFESAGATGAPEITSLSATGEIRANLDWHPQLLCGCLLLMLVAFRPKLRELFAVGMIAAVVLGVWVSVATALSVMLAIAVFTLTIHFWGRVRQPSRNQAEP